MVFPVVQMTRVDSISSICSNNNDSKSFLEISIKTTNLIIFALCTNILLIVILILKLPTYLFLIDVISDCISIYLSYSWASKYYQFLFKPCDYVCYSKLCNLLCHHCCIGSNNKTAQKNNNDVITCDTPSVNSINVENGIKNGIGNDDSPNIPNMELENVPQLIDQFTATSSNMSNPDFPLPVVPEAIDTNINRTIEIIAEGQSTATSYDMTVIDLTTGITTDVTTDNDNGNVNYLIY